MKGVLVLAGLLGGLAFFGIQAHAGNGQVRFGLVDTNGYLQVDGKANDEWRFQYSSDLATWSNAWAIDPLFSNPTNPPAAWLSFPSTNQLFYRAVQTEGLFDPLVMRTISLTFTQSNWQTLLKNYKTSGLNLMGNLEMGGTNYYGVGVRYRGNSSYQAAGVKKSVNIEINYTNAELKLMGHNTVNLNNANADESVMREALYFNTMRQYTICPHAALVKLNINGAYWGVYSFVQQEDSDLIKEWCPSADGDRWRAPNLAGGGGGPGGGGFNSGVSALTYLGTNLATYKTNYELKSSHLTNAWELLQNATYVLNKTGTNVLRDAVEDVLAVDRWLWFLAVENIFTDEDSYYYKGADYVLYYEPETGRIHPVEHDGNESSNTGDTSLSPVEGAKNNNRPVISRLLSIDELRQRYLAHMRTILQESFNTNELWPVIDRYREMSLPAIMADTKKSFTMNTYTSNVSGLKTYVQKRYNYLVAHAELTPVPPEILAVSEPNPVPTEAANITAQIAPHGNEGVSSAWLYYRDKSYGKFARSPMFDDGQHGDGAAGDGIYGGYTTNFAAGKKIHYYIEARSGNAAKAAVFAPAHAEEDTYSYHVAMAAATNTPVVINEILAVNDHAAKDPQGQNDDYLELRNLTASEANLSGRYLTDDPDKPRKWVFPDGTTIPAGGFLIVWMDKDTESTPGLHANFKLPAIGGQVFLIDTDANLNLTLDSVTYTAQSSDRAYGRSAASAEVWEIQTPTPGAANP